MPYSWLGCHSILTMALLRGANVQNSCDSNKNMNATRVTSFPRAGHIDSKTDTEKQARMET